MTTRVEVVLSVLVFVVALAWSHKALFLACIVHVVPFHTDAIEASVHPQRGVLPRAQPPAQAHPSSTYFQEGGGGD